MMIGVDPSAPEHMSDAVKHIYNTPTNEFV
jgi:hypothetical protein